MWSTFGYAFWSEHPLRKCILISMSTVWLLFQPWLFDNWGPWISDSSVLDPQQKRYSVPYIFLLNQSELHFHFHPPTPSNWLTSKSQAGENRSLTLCRLHPLPFRPEFVDAVTVALANDFIFHFMHSHVARNSPHPANFLSPKVLSSFCAVTRPPHAPYPYSNLGCNSKGVCLQFV